MKTLIISLFIVLNFIFLTQAVSAATINVPTNYSTIQAAINAASPGDTINVAAGTYIENVVVDKPLTLTGASSATVTVIAAINTASVFTVAASNVEISGFTATGTIMAGNEGYAGINFVSGVTNSNIHDNDVSNNQYGILLIEPLGNTASGSNTFTNNIASNCVVSGIEMQNTNGNTFTNNIANSNGAQGFRLANAKNNIFTSNIANSNGVLTTPGGSGGVGFFLVIAGGTGSNNNIFTNNIANSNINHGFRIDSSTGNTLTGNTFNSNGADGIKLKTADDNTVMNNNLCSLNAIGIEIANANIDATSLTVSHNNIVGNTVYGVSNLGTGTLNAENNWWGCNAGPGNPGCDSVSGNVDFTPWLVFQLTMPSPESKTYDSNKILVSLSTNLVADEIDYLSHGSYHKLCVNCDSYSKEMTFENGNNVFTVRAILDSETITKSVNFFVDSSKPKIKDTSPADNSFSKGIVIFTVKYSETNLQKVILHWKVSTVPSYTNVELTGCPVGNNKQCSTTIDLSSYDGSQINYYFEIQDSANTVSSVVKTITIDATAPTVTINSPTADIYGEKRISVNVGISEFVAKLEYSLDSHSFIVLCRNCNSLNREMTFVDGSHTLILRATDYAENTGSKSVTFSIDSKPPIINKQYPTNNKYANGTFYVVYSENNLKDMSLFYKGASDVSFTQVTKSDCESGKSKQCTFVVSLTPYDDGQIEYYFIVSNHVSQTTSHTYKETVDTTLPIITVNSPTATAYNSRKINLNIDVSEKVKLEYSDNYGKFQTICNDCMKVDKTRTFDKGNHVLIFRAIDIAGNSATTSVSFTVNV